MEETLHQHIDLQCVVQIGGRLDEATDNFGIATAAHRLQQMLGQLGTWQALVEVLEDRIGYGGQYAGKGFWYQLHNVLKVAKTVWGLSSVSQGENRLVVERN